MWVHELYNPFWINEELKRREIVLNEKHDNSIRHGAHRWEDFAWVAILKDCGKKKDLYKGTKVHAEIVSTGLLEKSAYLASALINMYAKCGAFSKAKQVLEDLPTRNSVTWNALISGYAQQGHGQKALDCFGKMQLEGISADAFTFTSILKACGSIVAIEEGQIIHNEIVGRGLLKRDVVLGTALVDMYAKCGLLRKAQLVLD